MSTFEESVTSEASGDNKDPKAGTKKKWKKPVRPTF
jgi:hypothetical protein